LSDANRIGPDQHGICAEINGQRMFTSFDPLSIGCNGICDDRTKIGRLQVQFDFAILDARDKPVAEIV
jgi:hypothetical protein